MIGAAAVRVALMTNAAAKPAGEEQKVLRPHKRPLLLDLTVRAA